jgi:hypothetical protein
MLPSKWRMLADNLLRGYSFLLVWVICIGTAMAGQNQSPWRAVHYSGRVVDRATGEPLEEARIALTSDHNYLWRADSKGKFSFWVQSQGNQRLTIEHEGYQTLELQLQGTAPHEIRLFPISRHIQLAASSDSGRFMAPSQSVAPAIVTADSGPRLSGPGAHWSHWYRLATGKAPGGYTLYRADFWLSGHRSCGAGAECRKIAASDREVLWEFRLQGHQEAGAPGRTYSMGHIRALYRAE